MHSRTSLNINIDNEATANRGRYNDLTAKIERYKSYFYNSSIKLTTNSYPADVYYNNGHNRQQLLMLEADLYSDPSVEYIGFVDSVSNVFFINRDIIIIMHYDRIVCLLFILIERIYSKIKSLSLMEESETLRTHGGNQFHYLLID